jgi:hypothetical protein
LHSRTAAYLARAFSEGTLVQAERNAKKKNQFFLHSRTAAYLARAFSEGTLVQAKRNAKFIWFFLDNREKVSIFAPLE